MTTAVIPREQAFFADIYVEALNSRPARGHRALAGMAAVGKLRRAYTLNIDGLHNAVGLTTWHPEQNPAGACAFPGERQGCDSRHISTNLDQT